MHLRLPTKRFRFTLRALLAVVALLAMWLAHERHVVSERDRLVQSVDFLRLFEPTPGVKGERQLPWHWKYFGAQPIEYMAIRLPDDHFHARDVERIRHIYPELEVSLVPSDNRR